MLFFFILCYNFIVYKFKGSDTAMQGIELSECNICPHRCNVKRIDGKLGRCKASDKIKIALASLHYYEEPCISGINGSGTVFFSNCNMRCKFC